MSSSFPVISFQQSDQNKGTDKKYKNPGWCKINSNQLIILTKQLSQDIKQERYNNNTKELQHEIINIQKEKNAHFIDTQQPPINCDKQRKRKKFLQKQEIIKIRDIFQKWQDSMDPSEFSNSNLSKKFNVSLSTIIRLRSEYHKDPTLIAVIQNVQKTSASGRKKGSMNDSTKVIRCLVHNELMKNRFLTRRQLQSTIQNNKDIRQLQIKIPSLKTISKIIQSLKIYRKRIRQIPRMTNEPDYLEKRLNFCQKYTAAKKHHASIIFIDLREIYLFMRPTYAWLQRGSNLQLQIPSSKQQKAVILVGINQNRIIQWQTKVGNYNDAEYTQSISKIFQGLLTRSISSNNSSILLVINNKRHQCQYQKILNDLPNKQKIQLLWLPPCNPQLNPIEIWFQQLRARVKQSQYETVFELLNSVKRQCRILQAQSTKNYIFEIEKYMQMGLKRETF